MQVRAWFQCRSCRLVSVAWQRVCPQTAHRTGLCDGVGRRLMPWVEKRIGEPAGSPATWPCTATLPAPNAPPARTRPRCWPPAPPTTPRRPSRQHLDRPHSRQGHLRATTSSRPGGPPGTSKSAPGPAYRSNLDHHLIPYFGDLPMDAILPSTVQAWVTHAVDGGLSPAVGREVPHAAARRSSPAPSATASSLSNPAADTELPKVITAHAAHPDPRRVRPAPGQRPGRFRPWSCSAIETGLRWGELVALRPRHLDFLDRDPHRRGDDRRGVQEELPHRPTDDPEALPERQRAPHPAHQPGAPPRSAARIKRLGLGRDDLLFASTSRRWAPALPHHLPRRVWLPALEKPSSTSTCACTTSPHQRLLAPRRRRRPQDRHGPPRPHPAHHHPAYLHTLPDTDDTALAAFEEVRNRR